jgi:putative Mg2+ transporter-C (MgtC) family protein
MTTPEIITRILLALVLGGMVGAERQWRQRFAGLRTNALVAVGAAMFALLGAMTPDELSPTRVAAQIVSGIGFLGAGVIFKEGLTVRGLNTAATLWCSAAVGALVGTGFLIPAIAGALVVPAAHATLRPVGRFLDRQPGLARDVETHYRCTVVTRDAQEPHVRMRLLRVADGDELLLRSIASHDVPETDRVKVEAHFLALGPAHRKMERMVGTLSLEPAVSAARWEVLQEED